MQIHEIKLKFKKKGRKRVGRGGKRGTYSGRGMKGQKSRSGVSISPLFEGGRSSLIERLKKMPGFKSPHLKKINVNLNDLEKNFKNGETVAISGLVKIGLVDKIKVKKARVKVLGDGKITKKLSINKEIFLSAAAKAAIEKAGGKILG
jgi:large subunit ribosomal protein L15